MKEQFGHLIVELKFLRFLLKDKVRIDSEGNTAEDKTRGFSSQS